MPVSKAMMITSDRTTSTTRSNTGEQRLLAQDLRQVGMLLGQQLADRVQLGRAAWEAKLLGQRAHDAPVGASVRRRQCAALLALDATLQIGDRPLALVGVRQRQEHLDAGIIRQGL